MARKNFTFENAAALLTIVSIVVVVVAAVTLQGCQSSEDKLWSNPQLYKELNKQYRPQPQGQTHAP